MADPVLAGAGTLLALAILSKWSWSRETGHRFQSGFPDLDKALAKIGEIIARLPKG